MILPPMKPLTRYRRTSEFQASFGSPVLLPWRDLVLVIRTGWSVPPGWTPPPGQELLSTYRATAGYIDLGADGTHLWVDWIGDDSAYGVQRACRWMVAPDAPETFDLELDRYFDVAHGQLIDTAPGDLAPGDTVLAYPWYATRLVRALRVYER